MSAVTDVKSYLASLPPERRPAIEAVRKVIRKHLPAGFEECFTFGMIGYCIPLSRYPDTYNGQPIGVAALASQKQYMAVYLHAVYADPALRKWFEGAYKASGKKLDMGKSCVRFKSLDDLPLDVLGETISRVSVADLIAHHEAAHPPAKPKKTAAKKR